MYMYLLNQVIFNTVILQAYTHAYMYMHGTFQCLLIVYLLTALHNCILIGVYPPPGVDVPESQQYHPEELNRKALAIIERVRQKLTGTICTCTCMIYGKPLYNRHYWNQ